MGHVCFVLKCVFLLYRPFKRRFGTTSVRFTLDFQFVAQRTFASLAFYLFAFLTANFSVGKMAKLVLAPCFSVVRCFLQPDTILKPLQRTFTLFTTDVHEKNKARVNS